ncbi:ArsC/Spx/MgsR family protein [Lactococcus garvieae]|uniref:ArsC/Spx/MgsR family protein n=1 Tax=Lactococcus garvieae TaxID=1363 RepID=UPI003D78A518
MITLYYGTSDISSKRVKRWFEETGIEVQMKKIKELSKEDLSQILFLSEEVFSDILKNNNRMNTHTEELLRKCKALSFNEALAFLLEHRELLRLPLIFDTHRLMIGFNDDEIRQFIPQSYRRVKLMYYWNNLYLMIKKQSVGQKSALCFFYVRRTEIRFLVTEGLKFRSSDFPVVGNLSFTKIKTLTKIKTYKKR